MEVNELRINNLVYYECKDNGSMINKIDGQDIYLMDTQDGYLELHNPIVINESWLLKCGLFRVKSNFAKADYGYLMGAYQIIYCNHTETWDVYLRNGVVAQIKYLHQLQNLYFALTNTELEINL